MSRDALRDASDELDRVSEAVVDEGTSADLAEQADQLRRLADRERDPDHGRLARHVHALAELRDRLDEDDAEHVQHALDSVREYRKTVEGV